MTVNCKKKYFSRNFVYLPCLMTGSCGGSLFAYDLISIICLFFLSSLNSIDFTKQTFELFGHLLLLSSGCYL